jgi:MoxR-like ATPase
MEGTYPLPEAQLDRFLLKVVVEAPSEELLTEVILRTTGHDLALPAPVLRREEALELRALCRDVAVSETVAGYVARLVSASVPSSARAPELVKSAVRYGAGVRGGQAMVLCAKAAALLDGRAHVAFEDVARVALPALRHRIILSFEGEADGVSPDAVVRALLDSVEKLPASVARAAEET